MFAFIRRQNSALFSGVVVSLLAALVSSGCAREEEKAVEPSLYERLGGLAPISVVVSDFIDALVSDAVLNQNPAIDEARKRVPAAYLKYHVTALVCQVTGGPCQYHGRSMKDSHAHLNITRREWDRMVSIFKEVLAAHEVPAKEQQDLLEAVASTRADIVVSQQAK